MFKERDQILLRCLLTFWLVKVTSSSNNQQLRRVCYFTNWSCDLLIKEAYFCLHDLDATLCSHLIYAFAGIDLASLNLSPTRVDDESIGDVKGRYIKFNDLKKNNSDLKTFLSAGGSYQAEKFKNVTSTSYSRRQFADNTARYVRRWGFDGLDLDWEFPGEFEKEALTLLVQELRSAFRDEATETGKPELLLSIAAPVGEDRVHLGYQVDQISKDVDMINLMAYDFYYGAWDITAFNSPLYSRRHHMFSNKHSVEWIVHLWISLGAPPHKINLGIAGYGQSFTLKVHEQSVLNAENSKVGSSDDSNIVQANSNVTNSYKHYTATAYTKTNTPSSKTGHSKSLSPSYHSELNSSRRCKSNSTNCVRNSRLSQTIKGTYNERYVTASHTGNLGEAHVPKPGHTDTPVNESSNTDHSDIAVYGGNSDQGSHRGTSMYRDDSSKRAYNDVTEYGKGAYKPDNTGTNRVGSNKNSNTDDLIYGVDSNKNSHTDDTVYGVGSKKNRQTDDTVYGVGSNKNRHTDDTIYGVGSKTNSHTDDKIYRVNSNKNSHTDDTIYGVDGNKNSHTDDTIYGVDGNKNSHTDDTIYGVNSNKNSHTDDTIYGVDGNKNSHTDDTIYGVDGNKNSHTDDTIYGVDGNKNSHTDDTIYGVNSNKNSYTDDTIYGVNSNKNSHTDDTIYGVDGNKNSHTDDTIYGVDGNKNSHTDDTIYGVDGNKNSHTDDTIYGVDGNKNSHTDAPIYGVGSKTIGPGRPGRLRHLKGQLSYPEICEMIQAGSVVSWDQEQRVPYITRGDQWVGFDNARSVAEKVRWASEQRIGGVMFWSLDLDDFKGNYCREGRFPLLSAMSETVISIFNQVNDNTPEHTTHISNVSRQSEGIYVLSSPIRGSIISHINDTASEKNLKRLRTNSTWNYNQTTVQHLDTMTTSQPQQQNGNGRATPKLKPVQNTPIFYQGVETSSPSHSIPERIPLSALIHGKIFNITEVADNQPLGTQTEEGPSTSMDMFPWEEPGTSDMNSLYDYYIALNAGSNLSTLITTTTPATTVGRPTTGKARTFLRNHRTSKRRLYRNSSQSLGASMTVIIYIVCLALVKCFITKT